MKQVIINGRSILLVGKEKWYPAMKLPPGNWQLLFADPLRPTNKELAEFMEYGTSLIKLWNHIVTSHGFTPGKVVGLIDKK